jgi:uncharacterized protein (TIGR01732 family)
MIVLFLKIQFKESVIMAYGYGCGGYGGYGYGGYGYGNSFVLIVVLFILLIIVGAAYVN